MKLLLLLALEIATLFATDARLEELIAKEAARVEQQLKQQQQDLARSSSVQDSAGDDGFRADDEFFNRKTDTWVPSWILHKYLNCCVSDPA
jgi:hypothetical protein